MKSKTELADIIEDAARKHFAGPFSTTAQVKEAFRDLGWTLGFKVSGHGIPPAASAARTDYGEWLYDLAWFEEDGDGFLVRTPLVMECEAKPDRHLDGDFQKLVQARADVRLWIATTHPVQSAETHINVCREQVAKFQGTLPGDIYVLVVYGKERSQPVIRRLISN